VGCGGVGCVMVWGVCGVGEGGLSFALEHSKVCTLCDFGHLQFFYFILILPGSRLKSAGIPDLKTVSASLILQCKIVDPVLPSSNEILSTLQTGLPE
jgi:hypothetical protein